MGESQEDYSARAERLWGDTPAWREFSRRHAGMSPEDERAMGAGLMRVFGDFGALRHGDPESPEAQALVARLRSYITDNYYTCTPEILASLGEMYAAGGEFTANIDAVGGEGTAAFASAAIRAYCGRPGR